MIEYCELHNLGINSVGGISAVCLRKRNYAYERIFRYFGDIVTEQDLKRLEESLAKPKFRHLYVLSLEGEILGEFDSAKKAELAGFGKESVILTCLNYPEQHCSVQGNLICETLEDYPRLIENYLRHVNDHGGWVTQYSLDGKYINRFPTVLAAINSLNKTSFTAIRECLKRGDSTYKAYGYMWRYSTSKDSVEPYKKCSKPTKSKTPNRVIQYTLDKQFVREFSSALEAAKELNIDDKSIRRAASGKRNQYNGYIWEYVKAV